MAYQWKALTAEELAQLPELCCSWCGVPAEEFGPESGCSWAWALPVVGQLYSCAPDCREQLDQELRDGHAADVDCFGYIDPGTDCCQLCGAGGGEPCPSCGGVRYHVSSCPELRDDPTAPDGWTMVTT